MLVEAGDLMFRLEKFHRFLFPFKKGCLRLGMTARRIHFKCCLVEYVHYVFSSTMQKFN